MVHSSCGWTCGWQVKLCDPSLTRAIPEHFRDGKGKGKGFPILSTKRWARADPGVQAVSPQMTVSHPPDGRLPLLSARPPQMQSITALWPVPSYTAWWQRHIGVNNLPKVVTQRCLEQDLNPWPIYHKSNALLVALPHHLQRWDGSWWSAIQIYGYFTLLYSSVLFLSLPRSEGWPHHGRTFSIYLYPLSFWLTLPQRVLSTILYSTVT